jgi:radical SAM protein with 4Fe4S-binding SPASM domain
LHVTAGQQRQLYDWLVARGEGVLTGDSFFHLAGYGEALPGLNLCGAGRVVCLVDPVGDVYACPFAIHENFLAGNVRSPGGFATVWRESELFTDLRRAQTGGACTSCSAFDACRGGCMAPTRNASRATALQPWPSSTAALHPDRRSIIRTAPGSP